MPAPTLSAPRGLHELPDGTRGTVCRVEAVSAQLRALAGRLAEIGFIEGEPVQVLRRGLGGREPIAVRVGDTMFALRLHEARCVVVTPSP